ncbi:MAG: PdxA family dehydrogenase [Christensenellales bacterium]
MMNKPILGLLLGDASGIGPELVAKLASSRFLETVCNPVIIGDIRQVRYSLSMLNMNVPLIAIESIKEADWEKGLPVLDTHDQDPTQIQPGVPSIVCGVAVMNMLKIACELCMAGKMEGFAFAPFNKAAMKMAGCDHESEHYYLAALTGAKGPIGEINVVGNLMSVRATSHIPLKDVSKHLTIEKILSAMELGYNAVRNTGVKYPRLGIAALNPHGGEDGRCGREEIDVILPAIEIANKRGYGTIGPFPSDIVFIKAFAGDFDCVVTMYHDQGQIALKLSGFDKGVTIAGGQPFPIATCAHGTAYEIVGKGIAHTTALENAVKLTAKMAVARRIL